MLTNIRLGNFKSWRELDIELAPITLLYGTNSSGKTSILHSLLLLKQTADNFDRGQSMNFGGTERDYINFGSYKDLVYKHNDENHIKVSLEWTDPIGIFSFDDAYNLNKFDISTMEFSVFWKQASNRIVVDRLEYRVFTNEQQSLELKAKRQVNKDQYTIELLPASSDKTKNNKYILKSFYELDPFSSRIFPYESRFAIFQSSRNLEELLSNISYVGPLRQHPQRHYQWTGSAPQTIEPSGKNTIEALISSVRRGSKKQDLLLQVKSWLQQLNLVSQFEVQALDHDKRFYETRVKIGSEEIYSSILDVGFGVSQILPVITMLYFVPKGSIVLIEQPELHLHPSAQAHLADLFLEVAEKRDLQLIIESHSEHLLRRFQRRIAEPENAFATPENIKAYFCKAGEEGSNIQPVEVDEYGQIRNWPDNFFGDLGGDLDAMMDAALERRRQELTVSG
jgi:predicted ATPase